MPGTTTDIQRFEVLGDTLPEDKTFPAFMVSTTRGFLPRQDPAATLPAEFDVLESLLQRMPIKMADGQPGLLAQGKFGEAVHQELPDLSHAILRYKDDLPLMTAIYRDYSFLASAYLLEPCHQRFMQGLEYGLGRQTLPFNIAVPIAKVGEIVGFKPFMEYAGSYALFNYKLENPTQGLEYDNLRLIRAFEHGLDPKSSEAGFVLVHVAMVRHSGSLVGGAMDTLDAASCKDRDAFNAGLGKVIDSLRKVNEVMNTMWNRSQPGSYTQFRTFIFGIQSQSMFPQGVIYEGVSTEPLSFRGESGANDSMIPLCDNLLEIAMPHTPLTDILKDFRSYRPGNHREFLAWVAEAATSYGVRDFARADPHSAALYVACLDQVRDFRWRHWCFAREYILKMTSHPTATGGSPIVTWLPNQLQAVLAHILEMAEMCEQTPCLVDMVEAARAQQDKLKKEVDRFCRDRKVVGDGTKDEQKTTAVETVA